MTVVGVYNIRPETLYDREQTENICRVCLAAERERFSVLRPFYQLPFGAAYHEAFVSVCSQSVMEEERLSLASPPLFSCIYMQYSQASSSVL